MRRPLARGAALLALPLACGLAFAQTPPVPEPVNPPPTGVDATRVDPLPEPPPTLPTPTVDDSSADDATDDAVAAGTQPPAPAPEPMTSDDGDFLAAAIASGEREVAAAALARSAAADAEVRDFAATLESDHRDANADLETLRAGTAVASRAAPEAPASETGLLTLRTLSSEDFDAAWLRWQREEHAAAITLFEKAVNGGDHSAPVRRAAAERLPQLRHHAARLGELQRRLASSD